MILGNQGSLTEFLVSLMKNKNRLKQKVKDNFLYFKRKIPRAGKT